MPGPIKQAIHLMSLEACAHEKWCGFLGGAESAHEKFRPLKSMAHYLMIVKKKKKK